ncbi:lipid droplet-associated hydrolase isoform X2 [Rhodamnia argentea]|uniref:Lipid droplet-associated hydrolase isoform X2 n=1 Tax=Rhodamnia argentea TaxID=178133 RepID=A0ABM3GT30_9MYRT|nr:lipid droplet-associated hydrolase isoform X2 [Rhodamnia argentea]
MLLLLLRLPCSAVAVRPLSLFRRRGTRISFKCECGVMGRESLPSKAATFRLCDVSGCATELLEVRSEDPALHVLFIPGNPGIVTYYKDFVESLYDLLGGNASITVVGHISHSKKDWENGRSFSLQEQIDHKVEFMRQEMQNTRAPLLLVGHSIGSYISMEILRKCPEKVTYCIGLYPFLALNPGSMKQSIIKNISAFIVANSLGKSWSPLAIEATCTHLLQYHTMRNMLFMAMTEFKQLSEVSDWAFLRGNREKIAFLFGVDDHWGPLQMFEEISKKIPEITLAIEREGHSHSFCCTEAGSVWVAEHITSLIKARILNSNQKI